MGDQWAQGRKGYEGGPMRWGTNENRAERVTLGDQWDGGPMSSNNAVGTMNWGPSRWEGTNAMRDQGPMRWGGGNERGDQWNGWCVGANWGTNEIGDQWDGGPLGLAEIGWINEKREPICCWGLMNWGTNDEKGTNEMGGTNESGGPMRRGINGMGDAWVLIGGPMRWGTDELGDQWDGEPMRWGTIGIGRWWGDKWKGGPMRWGTSDMGTNEMGDQWAPIMYWGTNELGDQWEGDQWDGGPMRWGTSERIPLYRTKFQLDQSVLSSRNPFYKHWLTAIQHGWIITFIIKCGIK